MNENTKIIEDAKSFFGLVDKYLIADLETLVFKIKSQETGGVGYACAQTILASMELMGQITSGKIKGQAFYHFWDNYLQPKYPIYNNTLKNIFRSVVRNGTAHIYFIKAGITINREGEHLSIHEYQGQRFLHINLTDLYSHFLICYDEIKKKILEEDINTLEGFKSGYSTFFKEMVDGAKLVSEYISSKSGEKEDIKPNNELTNVELKDITHTSTSGISVNIVESLSTQPPDYWLKGDQDSK